MSKIFIFVEKVQENVSKKKEVTKKIREKFWTKIKIEKGFKNYSNFKFKNRHRKNCFLSSYFSVPNWPKLVFLSPN